MTAAGGGSGKTNTTSIEFSDTSLVAAAVARTVHCPAPVYVIAPEVALTVHPLVPGLTTLYVMSPPFELLASTGGVKGDRKTVGERCRSVIAQAIFASGNNSRVNSAFVVAEYLVLVAVEVAITLQVPAVVKDILPELMSTTQLLVEFARSTEYNTGPPSVTGGELGRNGERLLEVGVGLQEIVPAKHDDFMAVTFESSVIFQSFVSARYTRAHVVAVLPTA